MAFYPPPPKKDDPKDLLPKPDYPLPTFLHRGIKATREGLIGQPTSLGFLVDRVVPFCALPDTRALRKFIRIRAHETGRVTLAVVLDVGPWNEHDSPYVFGEERPQAESGGPDERGRKTNSAGIDLGEACWHALGLSNNGLVDWAFLSPDSYPW